MNNKNNCLFYVFFLEIEYTSDPADIHSSKSGTDSEDDVPLKTLRATPVKKSKIKECGEKKKKKGSKGKV